MIKYIIIIKIEKEVIVDHTSRICTEVSAGHCSRKKYVYNTLLIIEALLE